MYIAIGFAIVAGICFRYARLFAEQTDTTILIYFSAGFGLGGALLGLISLRSWLSQRKFGSVPVLLNPWPAQLDGDIAGYFVLPGPVGANRGIEISLRCIRHSTSEYRDSEGRTSLRHHQQDFWMGRLDQSNTAPGARHIWFVFQPPAGLPPSSDPDDKGKVDSAHVVWLLRLEVRQAGINLLRSYEIPVFPGTLRSPCAQRQVESGKGKFASSLSQVAWVRRDTNAIRLVSKPFSAWPDAFVSGVVAGIMFWITPYFWPAGLFAFSFGLVAIFSAGLWRITWIDRVGMRQLVFLAFLPITYRNYAHDQIDGVDVKRTGFSGTFLGRVAIPFKLVVHAPTWSKYLPTLARGWNREQVDAARLELESMLRRFKR